jgi:hypothetical protein
VDRCTFGLYLKRERVDEEHLLAVQIETAYEGTPGTLSLFCSQQGGWSNLLKCVFIFLQFYSFLFLVPEPIYFYVSYSINHIKLCN